MHMCIQMAPSITSITYRYYLQINQKFYHGAALMLYACEHYPCIHEYHLAQAMLRSGRCRNIPSMAIRIYGIQYGGARLHIDTHHT